MVKNPVIVGLLAVFLFFHSSCRKEPGVQTPFSFSIETASTYGAFYGVDEVWVVLSDADGVIVGQRQLDPVPTGSVQLELLADGTEPQHDVTVAQHNAQSGQWNLRTWRNVQSSNVLRFDNPFPLTLGFFSFPPIGNGGAPLRTFTITGAPALDSLCVPAMLNNGQATLDDGVDPSVTGYPERGGLGLMIRVREAWQTGIKSLWQPDAQTADAVQQIPYSAFHADYPKRSFPLPFTGTKWFYKALAIGGETPDGPEYAVLDQSNRNGNLFPLSGVLEVDVPDEISATTFQLWGATSNLEFDWRYAPGETTVPVFNFYVPELRHSWENSRWILGAKVSHPAIIDVLHVGLFNSLGSGGWIITGSPAELERWVHPRFDASLPFASVPTDVIFMRTKAEVYEQADYAHGVLDVNYKEAYWRGKARYRSNTQTH